ncbi:MAG: T9SS type A sorting domain-containing protein [Chitinophagaceae bacterium]|nr:T9SS type A sorting domain-containing protein [Chitinophagaceae bacterium]MBK8952581.1 T9SS type A sorting domain-containing protein [Chitinophagaceae bacterium]
MDNRATLSRVERVNISDTKNLVEVFPNPVSGNNFTIKLLKDINGTVDVRVFDIKGGLQIHQQYSNSNFITINHHLTPGLYTIKVTTNEMTEVIKIIVQ